MRSTLFTLIPVLFLLAACGTTSRVERSVDLGFGFHRVTMAEPSHSSFEKTGHFQYLYFRDRRLCALGECSVSPSGRYAIYQDGPSGGIFLFSPADGLPIQLAQQSVAIVDSFEWHEEARFVAVRFTNRVGSQRFTLL